MKMTVKEANAYYLNLNATGRLALPAKLSFAITRNLEKLHKEVELMDKERQKLCERYAEKGEDGSPEMVDSVVNGKTVQEYNISPDNRRAFAEEFEALQESEIDVDVQTVKREIIEQCEKGERYSIPTVAQLNGLMFMLTE